MMFYLLPLLIAFGFLAIFDILDSKRIKTIFIIIGVLLVLFMNSLSILNGILLYIGIISVIILLFIKKIGAGDKILLATSFIIYPFYLIWAILLLAFILSEPFLKIKSFFMYHLLKKQRVSIAFYPFLFISTLIIYFILSII